MFPPLTYSTTGSAHLQNIIEVDTNYSTAQVEKLVTELITLKYALGSHAAHLNVRHTVVDRDQGHLPQQTEQPRHDCTGSQRPAHARPFGVADAVYLSVRESRLLQCLCGMMRRGRMSVSYNTRTIQCNTS